MFHGLANTIKRRRKLTITTAFLLSPLLTAWTFAQEPAKGKPATDQPAKFDHDAALAQVRASPLLEMELKNASGKDLTASEKADLEKAKKAMDDARAARKKGDFVAGTESARQAFELRHRILGEEHFLTVSSELLARVLAGVSTAPAARQQLFVEADKHLAEAEKLYDDGEYAKGIIAAKKALESREGLLSNDHQEVGQALRTLGKCQIEMRFMEEAETNLTRALTIAEGRYGKAHPQVALILDRLGWLKINQRKYQEAADAFRRAVSILSRTVGETPSLAESLDNLGTAELYLRQATGALRDKLRALVIRETLLGPGHAETGVSYSNIAWLYAQTGNMEQVIPLRLKARDILTKALGETHPWVFLELSNLARGYEATGDLAKAVELREKMVLHDKKSQERPDARAISRLRDLALLYFRLEKLEDGLKTLDEASGHAMDMFKSGNKEPAVQEIMAIVNVYERGFRMFDAACATLKRLHAAERASGKKPDEEMLRRWSRLANLQIETGTKSEAQALLTEIIGAIEAEKGKDALPLAEPLLMLARVQQDIGDYENAADTVERLLQVSEKRLPAAAPGKVFALAESARVDIHLKRFDMAKFSLDEASRIAEEKGNRERSPQAFIEAQRALADYHDARGQRDEAVAARKTALDSLRQVTQAARTLFLKGKLAELIKELLDSDDGKVLDATDRDELTNELKEILAELQKLQALNADNKEWLKQLG